VRLRLPEGPALTIAKSTVCFARELGGACIFIQDASTDHIKCGCAFNASSAVHASLFQDAYTDPTKLG